MSYKSDIHNAPPSISDNGDGCSGFDTRSANPTTYDVVWQWSKLCVLIFAAMAVAVVAWLFVVNFVFTWFDLWEQETKARADAMEVLATTACTQRAGLMPNEVCAYAGVILEHDKTLVVMHKFGREVAGTFPIIGKCLVDNDSCQTMWVYLIESVKGSMLYISIVVALVFALVYFFYVERAARTAFDVTRRRGGGTRLPGPDTPLAVKRAAEMATGSTHPPPDYLSVIGDAHRIGVDTTASARAKQL